MFWLGRTSILLEYMTTHLLSQYNLSGLSIPSIVHNLMTRFFKQIIWLDASKHAINSDAMMDEAIGVYLALRQEATPPVNM